jgi:hypothetical protein
MTSKKPKLDSATVRLMQKVLAMPPKSHDEMKVGRPTKKKNRGTKGSAVSAKPRSAS